MLTVTVVVCPTLAAVVLGKSDTEAFDTVTAAVPSDDP